MSGCHGNNVEHCCYVDGQVCKFLEVDTIPGRHWVCGLRRELGSWSAVHSDPRYLEHVKLAWERTGTSDCGDFGPKEKQCCFRQCEPTDEVDQLAQLPELGRRV